MTDNLKVECTRLHGLYFTRILDETLLRRGRTLPCSPWSGTQDDDTKSPPDVIGRDRQGWVLTGGGVFYQVGLGYDQESTESLSPRTLGEFVVNGVESRMVLDTGPGREDSRRTVVVTLVGIWGPYMSLITLLRYWTSDRTTSNFVTKSYFHETFTTLQCV